MFGAIWSFICGIAIAKDGIKNSVKDFNSKYDAIGNSPFGVYYDHKGRTRLIKDNQLVTVRNNNDGDLCVIAVPSGKVLRNISEEKRQEKKENLTNNYDEYHTVIDVTPKRNRLPKLTEFDESIYQDLKTGRKYVVREFKGMVYDKIKKKTVPNFYYRKFLSPEIAEKMAYLVLYMDIETGKFVRVADSYKRNLRKLEERKDRKKSDEMAQSSWKYIKFTYDHAEEFMKRFNENQDAIRKEMDLKNDIADFSRFYVTAYKSVCSEEEYKSEDHV